ncbi:hypothetical protein OH818_12670 [Jiella pelagia]|uniref:Uncharacterized protein n=1 Tax=Jiella pelagia TaxID=2986949 RepID=A0ABY7C3X0_9HYPH|nr:hypothetical protein [Jiella pelagia]WAP70777.1 hypothetical protein OH818_12670 [Jiella pelagia]
MIDRERLLPPGTLAQEIGEIELDVAVVRGKLRRSRVALQCLGDASLDLQRDAEIAHGIEVLRMDRERPAEARLGARRVAQGELRGAEDVEEREGAREARRQRRAGVDDKSVVVPVVGSLERPQLLDRRIADPLEQRLQSGGDAPVLRKLAEKLRIDVRRGVQLALLLEPASLSDRLLQLQTHRFQIVVSREAAE